jgi:hypothetical protein
MDAASAAIASTIAVRYPLSEDPNNSPLSLMNSATSDATAMTTPAAAVDPTARSTHRVGSTRSMGATSPSATTPEAIALRRKRGPIVGIAS